MRNAPHAATRQTVLLAAIGWLLAACGTSNTPEGEIRALIDAAETAAEERDAPALRGMVADDYHDTEGRDADEIRRYLHGYLVAHQSIHLVTRIDAIDLQGKELARVEVIIGVLDRDVDADSAWDLAGDIHRLDIRLAREGGEWRVTRAGRRPEN